MDFSWDEGKRRRVLRDHGLDFRDVKQAFDDPKQLHEYDAEHSLHEERWRMLGWLDGRVIAVVYTERSKSVQLITARYAEPREEQLFFDEFFGDPR